MTLSDVSRTAAGSDLAATLSLLPPRAGKNRAAIQRQSRSDRISARFWAALGGRRRQRRLAGLQEGLRAASARRDEAGLAG